MRTGGTMRESDIFVGVVAYMDVGILNRDPRVLKPESEVPRNGPFLCLRVVGTGGLWAPLVGRQLGNGKRLEIPPEWRSAGTDIWRSAPNCFLGDGATTYYGPHTSFARAAHIDQYYRGSRKYAPPRISMEGVQAVRAVVQKRGGNWGLIE